MAKVIAQRPRFGRSTADIVRFTNSFTYLLTNLTIGGISANCGFRPPNLPFSWGPGPLSNTVLGLLGTTRASVPNGISFCFSRAHGCDIYNIQCESKKNPPEIFWHFFPNSWEFFVQILHACYMFLSTLDYKFLFNYLQL